MIVIADDDNFISQISDAQKYIYYGMLVCQN